MTTESTPSLLHCLGIQRRVLHALLMREIITRFGREKLGVLWLVGEPMLFTLGVATMWTATGLCIAELTTADYRVESGNSSSGFSSSSMLTSLNVTTRTVFTNRSGRYMSHTQASRMVSSK